MYDPSVGRFVSQDPIGFDAGDSNLYRYVDNSPTNAVDPSGLKKAIVIEIHVHLPTIAPQGVPKATQAEVLRLLQDANKRGGGDPKNTITIKWVTLASRAAYDRVKTGAGGTIFANGNATFRVCENTKLRSIGGGHVAHGADFSAKIEPTKFNQQWPKVNVPRNQRNQKKELTLAAVIVHELFLHGLVNFQIDLANSHPTKTGFIDSAKPSVGGTNTLSKQTCEMIVQRFNWD